MLLRYGEDGALLRKYGAESGLTAGLLLELALAPDGSLWVATDRGAFHFDNERFKAYTVEQGLNHDLVHAIAADRYGRIFVGTERGTGMLEGGRFVPLEESHEYCRRPTYAVHPSPDGTLWLAKENALTQRLPSGEWRIFRRDPLTPGPRARIIANSVRALAIDDLNHLWIGTHEGLGHFDERAWRRHPFRERFSRSGGPAHNHIETLAWEEGGALWIGYGDARDFEGGAGVTRYKDGEWLHLTEEEGLLDNRVYRIRVGEDGDKWFATARGVSRYRDGEFVDHYQVWGR
jgi:ligand-binding sensor domain-containing protein